MNKIKVLLVDDQVLFVENLRFVLDQMCDDIETVGVALDSEQARGLVATYEPDIVLLDIRMPGIGGCQLVKQLRTIKADIQIVMLTTFDDDEYIREALDNGAIGYLLKGISPSELIESIRAVMANQVVISPDIARKLLKNTPATASRKNLLSGAEKDDEEIDTRPKWMTELSGRERELVKLMAQGFDNRQIAEKACLAEQTEPVSKIGLRLRRNTGWHAIDRYRGAIGGNFSRSHGRLKALCATKRLRSSCADTPLPALTHELTYESTTVRSAAAIAPAR